MSPGSAASIAAWMLVKSQPERQTTTVLGLRVERLGVPLKMPKSSKSFTNPDVVDETWVKLSGVPLAGFVRRLIRRLAASSTCVSAGIKA